MVRLTANVILAHPETGVPEILVMGSDLPDWAVGLVGEHVLEQDGYSGTAAELKAEIEARNAARSEDLHIVPASGKKADLIAALEADDEAASG